MSTFFRFEIDGVLLQTSRFRDVKGFVLYQDADAELKFPAIVYGDYFFRRNKGQSYEKIPHTTDPLRLSIFF